MKRILIFLFLGPTLCLALLSLPTAVKSPAAFLPIFLTLAPIALPFVLPLMAIAGAVDWLFAKSTWTRIAASAAVTYVAVIMFQYLTGPLVMLSLGLVGAIPAALCSWLTACWQPNARG